MKENKEISEKNLKIFTRGISNDNDLYCKII